MNLRGKMKKLQTAIVKKGLVIKINSNQFYSAEQKRMITAYSITIPTVKKCDSIDLVSNGKSHIEVTKSTISITFMDKDSMIHTAKIDNNGLITLVACEKATMNGKDFLIFKGCSMPKLIFCLLDIYKAVS